MYDLVWNVVSFVSFGNNPNCTHCTVCFTSVVHGIVTNVWKYFYWYTFDTYYSNIVYMIVAIKWIDDCKRKNNIISTRIFFNYSPCELNYLAPLKLFMKCIRKKYNDSICIFHYKSIWTKRDGIIQGINLLIILSLFFHQLDVQLVL